MNNTYRPLPWWRVNRGKRSKIRPHSHPRYPSRGRPIRQDGIGAHAPIAWPLRCPTALCRFQLRQSSMARYLTPPQAHSASVPGTRGLCVVILPPTLQCALLAISAEGAAEWRSAITMTASASCRHGGGMSGRAIRDKRCYRVVLIVDIFYTSAGRDRWLQP